MKAGKIKIILSSIAIVMLIVFAFLLIFGVFTKGGDKDPFFDYSLGDPKTMYGEDAIFDEAFGWANSDPSAIQTTDGTRYVYYTANQTIFGFDNAIVCRKGVAVNGVYEYENRKTVLTVTENSWDSFHIGSADVVKGKFTYQGTTYSYLMAYQANAIESEERCFEIGFAVSNDPYGKFVKVGTKAVLSNDATKNKENVLGYYAPSLVSNDGEGNVRLFFTYGNAFGHFQYFADINCSNLDNIAPFGTIILSGEGLATGEGIVMFPNADFIYDSANGRYFVIKDFSPSADTLPRKAYQIELAVIDEDNLLTADLYNGWESLQIINGFTVMGDKDGWERIYSGSIVSDEYGNKLSGDKIEILYNACDIADNEPDDYLWTPSIHSYIYNVA